MAPCLPNASQTSGPGVRGLQKRGFSSPFPLIALASADALGVCQPHCPSLPLNHAWSLLAAALFATLFLQPERFLSLQDPDEIPHCSQNSPLSTCPGVILLQPCDVYSVHQYLHSLFPRILSLTISEVWNVSFFSFDHQSQLGCLSQKYSYS